MEIVTEANMQFVYSKSVSPSYKGTKNRCLMYNYVHWAEWVSWRVQTMKKFTRI